MKKRTGFILIGAIAIIALILILINRQAPRVETPKSLWQTRVTAPIMTRWAKDVSPEAVLSEYPRPQMTRERWLNLNGLWGYGEGGTDTVGQVLVPFPMESALSGVMKSIERFWYRRTFEVPAGWKGERVLLHFGAVDYEATVSVNGKQLSRHRGGYDPFTVDITEALRESGPQEITVGVVDPTDAGEQPRGKQVRKPGGIWYTPTTGIWQTVWCEPVPQAYITGLLMVPDPDNNCLRLTVSASDGALEVKASASDSGVQVGSVTGSSGRELVLPLARKTLWSPSNPFLYDLEVELLKDGRKLDAVRSYFGLRKVAIARDAKGINRIMVNGEFTLLIGPLDQGFWPDGIYTAPTDEALRSDIEMTKKLGFNMTRKHVKVEPDRWYYWADRLGLIVWQDMPSGENRTPEAKREFEAELKQLVETHRNHPSIIMWVVFNEGWGQYDTERLTEWVRELDPSRLVNNASGWADKKSGDVNDIHNYPEPRSPKPEGKRAIVLGEFGGLGLAMDGHTWKKEHWGYQGMAGTDQLTGRYEKFLQTVYKYRDDPGLSAAVYTQITDVEVECNGLLTYDREVVKPDPERVAAVNRGDFSKIPPPPVVEVVVPTSETAGQRWKYTTVKPAEGWYAAEFDAAGWKTGAGGFGTKVTPGTVVRTEWKTPDIWLRRVMTLPEKEFTSLQFRTHHDENAEVYVNGKLALKLSGFSTEYEEMPISAEARAAFRAGSNTIAVHCHQTEGGQYIDLGLVDVKPAPPVR